MTVSSLLLPEELHPNGKPAQESVRIYLCDNETKSFYAGDSNWVDEERYALRFASCIRAIKGAIQFHLHDVFILMALGDHHYALSLPVGEEEGIEF